MEFMVDREVQVSVPLTPWVSRRFSAFPGQVYDAALSNGGGGKVAKFAITFVQHGAARVREDETVEADEFKDAPPFIDFYAPNGLVVARYRQDDIRRIQREGY